MIITTLGVSHALGAMGEEGGGGKQGGTKNDRAGRQGRSRFDLFDLAWAMSVGRIDVLPECLIV